METSFSDWRVNNMSDNSKELLRKMFDCLRQSAPYGRSYSVYRFAIETVYYLFETNETDYDQHTAILHAMDRIYYY